MISGHKISIIVVSFNGAEFIENCLSSIIISLKNQPYELLAVDNGSEDSTVEIIETQFPSVKLIANDTNRGFAAALNQGMKASEGELTLLLNQDIRVRDKSIISMTERLLQDNHIGVIGPKFVDFTGRLLRSARAFPIYRDLIFEFSGLAYLFPKSELYSRWKMGWFDHEREMPVDQPMGAAMMFRRSLTDEIGLFDESFPIFFNDVDFCRRAKNRGYINLYYPDAIIEHFVGGSTSKHKAAMIFESHRAMYRYFLKYSRGFLGETAAHFWGFILFITAFVRAGIYLVFRK